MTTLNIVHGITATAEPGVYIVNCNITDADGETDTDYCSRPDDPFGINPAIRQWISDNPDFPIAPYVPPSVEEVRASMSALTARQFRLGMLEGGITPSNITNIIEAMPEGPEKETAKIEWEYATSFSRLHPLVIQLSAALGLTPEGVDTLWNNAINL